MASPIKYLAPFVNEVEWIADFLGGGEFLPSNAIMDIWADLVCDNTILQELCESALFLLCGFDESQFNKTMLETLTHHTPAGTSTRTVVHYGRNYGSEIIHWLCLKKLLRRTLISFRSNIRGSLLPYIWPPVCSYSVK